MDNKNILTSSIIVAIATALVIAYAVFHPATAALTMIVYMLTIISLTIITLCASAVYKKFRTSIDIEDIADITENLNTEIIIWTDDCSAVFFNKRMRTLLGIEKNNFDNAAELQRAFGISSLSKEALAKLVDNDIDEAVFKASDGKNNSIAWSTSLIRQTPKCNLYMSTGFNLTEMKKMQVYLRSTNDRFNLSMELAEIGVIICSDMKNYHASPEMVRMLGLKSDTIGVKEFRLLIHPNDRILYESSMKMLVRKNFNNDEVKNIEIRIKSADGMYRWYSYRFKAIRTANDNLPLIGGALLDVTKEHEKDVLIERLAYIDEVTEIPNRNKLVNVGQETYECCKHLNYSYWIIVLDIDRFHIVNDTCGYEKGNDLLKDFAHILYKFVSPGGLAARISGDNFALILRDYGDEELPVRTAHTIQEEIMKLAVDDLASINLTCSVGYSKMPEDGSSFLDVMEHAEFALKSGSDAPGSINAYESSMHDSIIGITELEKSLANAIDNNELQLFYQPKIDLATGKIMGVEALVRWIKPDGTIISPSSFVPIAEGSHLIGRISEFVLNEACRQNMMWQRMGYPNIVVSINFASSDFYQKDLKEKVFEALIKSGLEPKWLEVELTESLALSDIDFAVSQMNKLRELGVHLAMDDFGTGYSSLSYLQILPITLLKLDRSFITNIEHDNIAYEIVSAVIRIAKSKKIETIAEGIENSTQEEILRLAGCDYAQGYLYGKPMPPQEIERFFEINMKKS